MSSRPKRKWRSGGTVLLAAGVLIAAAVVPCRAGIERIAGLPTPAEMLRALGLGGGEDVPIAAPAAAASQPAAEAAGPTTEPTTRPFAEAPPDPNEVKALVDDLSSDVWAKREAAQQKLVKLGPAGAPLLRAALASKPGDEVRARLEAALKKIDLNHTLGPSVITLRYANAPMADVLADFAEQAGADMGLKRQTVVDYCKGKQVTLDVDHGTFWDALREVGRATGLHVQMYNTETLLLTPNMGGGPDFLDAPGVQSGPFWIAAQSCQRTRYMNYARGGGGGGANFSLQLTAVPEPKIRLAGQPNPDWLTECTDDKGHNLANAHENTYYGYGSRQPLLNLQTALRDAPDIGTKITRLAGTLRVAVATRTETVRIDDVQHARNVTRGAGGNSLQLVDVTKNGNGQWQVHFSVSAAAAAAAAATAGQGQQAWAQLQALAAAVRVLDPNGNELMSQGGSSSNTGTRLECTYNYMQANFGGGQIPGEPSKLVWEVATETKPLSVPFTMKDLPLP